MINKKIVLIRHGPTMSTELGLYCGSSDPPLSKLGFRLASYITKNFNLNGVEVILSSPLIRARQTASYTATSRDLNIIEDEGFREMCFGEWEGLSRDDICDTKIYQNWSKNPAQYTPPGGESAKVVLHRSKNAIINYMRLYDNLAIFTHKAVIRLLYSHFTGIPINQYRDIRAIPTGSVTYLEFNSNNILKTKLGDMSHVPTKLHNLSILNY